MANQAAKIGHAPRQGELEVRSEFVQGHASLARILLLKSGSLAIDRRRPPRHENFTKLFLMKF
jgi:hypothetical protein